MEKCLELPLKRTFLKTPLQTEEFFPKIFRATIHAPELCPKCGPGDFAPSANGNPVLKLTKFFVISNKKCATQCNIMSCFKY